jgi:hypothetical protein
MRYCFLFTIVLVTAGTAVSAQQQEPVMTRSQLTPFEKIPPVHLLVGPTTDTTTLKCSLITNSYIKDRYYEDAMVESNSPGKVYRMPVDNMLCLVPDATKTSRMPVKKIKAPERMPNAFSRSRMYKDRMTKEGRY